MQWSDRAIILHTARHGEKGMIVHSFTREQGIRSGMAMGVQKYAPLCQTGNLVNVTWQARLEEHLGRFTQIESEKAYSAMILFSRPHLLAMQSALMLLYHLLSEHDPHPQLFDETLVMLQDLATRSPHAARSYVTFELHLLRELGYGLQLEACVDSGSRENLLYVSPKSGCAVSESSGAPYAHKLLKLPTFLRPGAKPEKIPHEEQQDGLHLTGYFLNSVCMSLLHRPLPEARNHYVQALRNYA